ncbi:MAG: alpha/beta hydrolase [Actinomycetota bacterium]|nr:alpha/beta hydrolase [Actinomycetota bacterium]
MVHVNGVDLCAQTFGDPEDPAILLIGGAASSMDWWEDDFCAQLAAGGRDPDRVATLILISTSPGGPGGPDNPDLPPMGEQIEAAFSDPAPEPDWSDRRAVIDYMVEGQRPFEGTHPFDEAGLRVLVGQVFDRTNDMAASMTNHWMLEGGDPIRARLGQVGAPTLVLHGTEDPLFPIGHGKALADEIPGAVLIPLEGVGHQMPPRQVWEVVIPAILAHTAISATEAGRSSE